MGRSTTPPSLQRTKGFTKGERDGLEVPGVIRPETRAKEIRKKGLQREGNTAFIKSRSSPWQKSFDERK